VSKFKDLKMPELKLDMEDPHIRKLSKKVHYIDIETSLVEAGVFRTGTQYIQANQLSNTTKILTVAGGSLFDLITKGEEGVWSLSNHRSSTFKKDPLDDSEVLATVWDILDSAEVVIAHNAAFDKGWLMGRFLELGWKLPSRFFLFCTYQNLRPFNMTSKKLDEISRNLIGTKKISTDMELWRRCSRGEKKAFEEMAAYNVGDIYNTMHKVYMRTAQYNPMKAIDFTNYGTEVITCRVDGQYLEEDGTYFNRANGLEYIRYKNPRNGIVYRDRYNITSKKAGTGFVIPYV